MSSRLAIYTRPDHGATCMLLLIGYCALNVTSLFHSKQRQQYLLAAVGCVTQDETLLTVCTTSQPDLLSASHSCMLGMRQQRWDC
jgi:hypothetical protein